MAYNERNPRRLSLEDELLVLLARGTLTPAEHDKAYDLLEHGLAWPLILRQSRRYGVFPMLYRHLQRFGFAGVPAEIRTELETAYHMNALRNLALVRELTQVMQLLAAAGVPVIPLKGVALAASLCGTRSGSCAISLNSTGGCCGGRLWMEGLQRTCGPRRVHTPALGFQPTR